MDGNNLHTSVVIELPNEKEPDRVNKFKIDLEDVDASKEYVIDELFCGDEVAVYALFEASEIANIKSQRHFMTVSNSNFDEEELRFTHRCAVQKRINKNIYNKRAVIDFEESDSGLEHTGDNVNVRKCDIGCEEESPTCAGETGNSKKFESTSTGVNTDIGQSPKLLEEVQKAISLNFSKIDDRNPDLSFSFSRKSSCDVMEMISSTTFVSDAENRGNKKSLTSNVVIVPIILKEEKLSHIWKNDQQLPDEESSRMSVLEKVSVSTSTDTSSPDNGNNEELKMLQNNHDIGGKLNEEVKSLNLQAYLMEEIKNLQEKFNYLLNSLENIGLTQPKEKESKEMKELEEAKDETLEQEKSKTIWKSLNKFDAIPIFSPEPFTFLQSKNLDKITKNVIDVKTEPSLSNSVSFIKKLVDEIGMAGHKIDDILANTYDPPKEEEKITELVNWEEIKNHRGSQLSKSQANIYCFKSKNSINLKKSLSADLSEEAVKLKMIENIFFKLKNIKKQKNKERRQNEKLETVRKKSEGKLHESEKSEVDYYSNSMTTNGLLKFEKDKLNKISEKNTTEKLMTPNQINQRISNVESDDGKDPKVIKKTGVKSKLTEKLKGESKIPYQVFQQKCISVNRRNMVKRTGQSKLHVDLLIKNSTNSEQKNKSTVKPKLPRLNSHRKDQKTSDIEPLQAADLSVGKNLEQKEIDKNDTVGPEKALPPTTSEVIVELFSKKPTSVKDFYSEVDLESLYNNDPDLKNNSTLWKTESSSDCKNPVVKSVWALTKVLLYEDGTKKMEVLEASLNPPDYHLNQNLTEDKVR